MVAANQMRDRPQGNRHVVMITDGVQSPAKESIESGLSKLRAANAVVHVISYTSVSGKPWSRQRRLKRNRDKEPGPRGRVEIDRRRSGTRGNESRSTGWRNFRFGSGEATAD